MNENVIRLILRLALLLFSRRTTRHAPANHVAALTRIGALQLNFGFNAPQDIITGPFCSAVQTDEKK
jgi:hypothetical protein